MVRELATNRSSEPSKKERVEGSLLEMYDYLRGSHSRQLLAEVTSLPRTGRRRPR